MSIIGRTDVDFAEGQGSAVRPLKARAKLVAAAAAEHALDVDRAARFPAEALAAARKEHLLGVMVPPALGGEGASIGDTVDICYRLASACASTAMIFAMHQIMVAILVRHAAGSPWHRGLLQRLAHEQLLLASSTTDGKGGGDLRASSCAIEQRDARIALIKAATVMSYGAEADAILTTARRAPDALPSAQVLVAFLKDDYVLEPSMTWDALGMRGTCSAGFTFRGEGDADQILPEPYSRIHVHTMMPVAHLMWSAVWAGIAAGALERARSFSRTAARKGDGLPPGIAHVTQATATFQSLRAIIASALQRFESSARSEEECESLEFQASMNLLKVNASELAISAVLTSLRACGLAGYRNDGDFSVTRHLRDALSSAVMISNDRILANSATASLLMEMPLSLREAP